MNTGRMRRLTVPVLAAVLMLLFVPAAFASDDNSLADLGITTEGVLVTPDFRYDTWEYNVEVPSGTTELALSPRATNPGATINSVTGTTLDQDGNGTVVITVTSESGNPFEYVLHVTAARAQLDPAAAIAANESSAAVTIDTEVVQSEVETEDPRYVKVDRNSLVDAENTIEKLQGEITTQREHIRLLTYVVYGLIAVSIIFLFIIISQLLRRKDMSQELAEYRRSDPYGTKGSGAQVPVAEDGWGEWGDDEDSAPAGKKKKKGRKAKEEDWEDAPVNSRTSWTEAQVGTPVPPQRPAKSNDPQYPKRRDAKPRQSAQQSAPGDETRLYHSVQPVHPQDVPKDVTKDLTKVNKAEAKAMKKAEAARARAEQDARRAAQARSAEAKRQADEAKKLAERTEAARAAQEAAVQKASEESAAREAAQQEASGQSAAGTAAGAALEASSAAAPKGGQEGAGVKIDMIDL